MWEEVEQGVGRREKKLIKSGRSILDDERNLSECRHWSHSCVVLFTCSDGMPSAVCVINTPTLIEQFGVECIFWYLLSQIWVNQMDNSMENKDFRGHFTARDVGRKINVLSIVQTSTVDDKRHFSIFIPSFRVRKMQTKRGCHWHLAGSFDRIKLHSQCNLTYFSLVFAQSCAHCAIYLQFAISNGENGT